LVTVLAKARQVQHRDRPRDPAHDRSPPLCPRNFRWQALAERHLHDLRAHINRPRFDLPGEPRAIVRADA